jgi:hypothetical protein
MAGLPQVRPLPPCRNCCQIICWYRHRSPRPRCLCHPTYLQYTTASRRRRQNGRYSIHTPGFLTMDGEHVCRHHLPERTWRSPHSLHPTATVSHPASPVCCPTAAAIFRPTTAKLHRFCHPHLHRRSPRTEVPLQWVS